MSMVWQAQQEWETPLYSMTTPFVLKLSKPVVSSSNRINSGLSRNLLDPDLTVNQTSNSLP